MKFRNVAVAFVMATMVAGCASQTPQPQQNTNNECMQEDVPAPSWTCIADIPSYYAGVGIAEKSPAGAAHMKRVALLNARSDLAQQIETHIKDKIESFTQATTNGSRKTVQKVTTMVTKQISQVDLKNSKIAKVWHAPSGALYILVTMPKKALNQQVHNAFEQITSTSSLKNEDALWQRFLSKKAQEELEKEFPTH